MPVDIYMNWNNRPSDQIAQIAPFRKYYFICEGANTEEFYFEHLIDIKKELGLHSLIDIRLLKKTGKDRDISYPKKLFSFAIEEKEKLENNFNKEYDKMVIVFDGDIFEGKVVGYEELIDSIEKDDIAAVTNPNFEVFLLLHLEKSYEEHIQNHEVDFFQKDVHNRYSYPHNKLRELTGMNSKKNRNIGTLAASIHIAIEQERFINQNIHDLKGHVSSNIGKIIEEIIKDQPQL